ncbi:MAG: hypothetical protein KIT31_03520, partial [Deltaproteobacteria bacterium]|nr:hypothetical protein [Deltaproteobacteria bacterium]
ARRTLLLLAAALVPAVIVFALRRGHDAAAVEPVTSPPAQLDEPPHVVKMLPAPPAMHHATPHATAPISVGPPRRR